MNDGHALQKMLFNEEKDGGIFSPQATGISTGSVYKDFALLKNGFVPCFDTNIMIIQNMYVRQKN